jgi:hypothetical protein
MREQRYKGGCSHQKTRVSFRPLAKPTNCKSLTTLSGILFIPSSNVHPALMELLEDLLQMVSCSRKRLTSLITQICFIPFLSVMNCLGTTRAINIQLRKVVQFCAADSIREEFLTLKDLPLVFDIAAVSMGMSTNDLLDEQIQILKKRLNEEIGLVYWQQGACCPWKRNLGEVTVIAITEIQPHTPLAYLLRDNPNSSGPTRSITRSFRHTEPFHTRLMQSIDR